MLKILALSGSPRKNGNTETLVDAAVQPFVNAGHEVAKFYLSERKVAPCIACEACAREHVCVVKDDWQWVAERLHGFDAIIVGSPVYNRNVSAQLQALFNRFHCLLHSHPFENRVCFGGAIAVGGAPNSQGIVLNVLHNFLLSLGLCCVPGVLNGVSVVAREKGEVLSQPKSLFAAKVLGENVLRALTRGQPG